MSDNGEVYAVDDPAEGKPSTRLWRHEDPEFGENQQLVVGGMFRHQREWWNLPNRIRLLVGGYGSGKTMILCKRALAVSLENSPAPSLMVSPTYTMARDTVIETLIDLLNGKQTLLPGLRWHMNQMASTFYIHYRQRLARIIVRSGDNPMRLKGANIGAAFIDEPFVQDRAVFDQVLARVRHPKAVIHEINLTGTPEQLNWGYDLAEGELADKHDCGYVRAGTRDNLALSPKYAESLYAGYDEKTAKAYLDGLFVNLAAGMVYHAFDPDVNIVDDADVRGLRWGAGMDFNVNPMAFCVFRFGPKRMHVVKDYELPNSDTEEACKQILRDFPEVRDVYPDPSGRARHTNAPGGKSDFSYIKGAGMRVNAPEQAWGIRDSVNAVNGVLKGGVLTISPDCKRLKKYLSTHSWELVLKQKQMTHLLDAVRYPSAYLFPVFRETTRQTVLTGA